MIVNETNEAVRRAVKKELDPDRYIHTMGVACTAQALSMRWGEDPGRAYLAGLLHDCAKCIPKKDRLPLCEKWGIEVNATEMANTSLLHAKMGEYLAKERYGVNDGEILSSIRFHTTGRPGMTLLEKIIYVADYVEPNRDRAPDLPKLRKLVFTDIDRAVFLISEATLSYVRDTVGESEGIDPETLRTAEYYRALTEKGEKSDE